MEKTMKSLIRLLLMALCFIGVVSTTSVKIISKSESKNSSYQSVLIEIDGKRVIFSGQQPIVEEGITLVPVRGVFEHLGFNVVWDEYTKTVNLSNRRNIITINVGCNAFLANGTEYSLETTAQIINSRVMLPLRPIIESVGYSVSWSRNTNTVIISSGKPLATRLALVKLEEPSGGYYFEIMSDGKGRANLDQRKSAS